MVGITACDVVVHDAVVGGAPTDSSIVTGRVSSHRRVLEETIVRAATVVTGRVPDKHTIVASTTKGTAA